MQSFRTTVPIEKRYFDINKFENLVFNKNRIRAKKIKTQKLLKFVDVLMVFLMVFMFFVFAFFSIKILTSNILISKQKKDIAKLESTLNTKRLNNKKLNDEIANMLDKDYIKSVAFLNLSMFQPTDANVIYYDKIDDGYVRHIDEIK